MTGLPRPVTNGIEAPVEEDVGGRRFFKPLIVLTGAVGKPPPGNLSSFRVRLGVRTTIMARVRVIFRWRIISSVMTIIVLISED